MIKKGIILAGGSGTRLAPLTKAVNKQLLPIYDKPLIYYSLSVLMLAKIKKILIIVNKGDTKKFKDLFSFGNDLGLEINYLEQKAPNGIPEGLILGEKFIGKDNVALMLGDNFFYGQGFTKQLLRASKKLRNSTIFVYPVNNPSSFGIVSLGKNNKIYKIEEKPKKTKSNLAITGLYFFDNKAAKLAKKLKFSKRKELEIVDLLKNYNKLGKVKVEKLGRGSAWLDNGEIENLQDASKFVEGLEKRQGLKIACLEEIALNNKWIQKKHLSKRIKFYGNSNYSRYLKKLIQNN